MSYGDLIPFLAIVVMGLATVMITVGLSMLFTSIVNRGRSHRLRRLATRMGVKIVSFTTSTRGRTWVQMTGKYKSLPLTINIIRNTVTVGADTTKSTGYCHTEVALTTQNHGRKDWKLTLIPGSAPKFTESELSAELLNFLYQRWLTSDNRPLIISSEPDGYRATVFCDLRNETDMHQVEKAVNLIVDLNESINQRQGYPGNGHQP